MVSANDNNGPSNDNNRYEYDGEIKSVRVIHADGSESKVDLDTTVYVSNLERDWEEAWTLGYALEKMYDQGCPEESMAWMTAELVRTGEIVNASGRIGLWPHKETRQ